MIQSMRVLLRSLGAPWVRAQRSVGRRTQKGSESTPIRPPNGVGQSKHLPWVCKTTSAKTPYVADLGHFQRQIRPGSRLGALGGLRQGPAHSSARHSAAARCNLEARLDSRTRFHSFSHFLCLLLRNNSVKPAQTGTIDDSHAV